MISLQSNMDFSMKSDQLDPMNGNNGQTTSGSSPTSKKQKNIPVELTAFGTTPSGKPRLFVCQVCTRAFARLEHLRRHERSHTKEKPFSCGVCQRKFSRRDLLLRHAQKLHAGCADAITRLRRKSLKRSGSQSHDLDVDMDNEMEYGDFDDEGGSPDDGSKSPSKRTTNASTPSTSMDSVHFNLNLFNQKKLQLQQQQLQHHQQQLQQQLHQQQQLPTTQNSKLNRSASIKDLNLQRQMFDRKKMGRNRGASFSAQSGSNYSMGINDFNDIYPGTDNVEFSTPQLLATSTSDENSWLNNLSTIPGMENQQNNPNIAQHPQMNGKHHSIVSLSLGDELPHNPSHHGSFSGPIPHGRSDSLNSIQSFSTYESMGMLYGLSEPQRGSISGGTPDMNIQNGNTPGPTPTSNPLRSMTSLMPEHTSGGDYGYSFYDIPESMIGAAKFENFRLPMGLSTIKQEDEEEYQQQIQLNQPQQQQNLNQQHQQHQIPPLQQQQRGKQYPPQTGRNNYHANPNLDLSFLNDIGELAHEYDVNSKFMPNGYSFYGDNASVSSSGIETSSPHNSSTTPQQQGAPHFPLQHQALSGGNDCLNQSQMMNIEGTKSSMSPQPIKQKKRKSIVAFKVGNYSKNKLFTENMRYMINKALGKYPISGIMTPSIPSNEKLEFYLNNFVNIFLSHFPFIHILKLNEHEMMNMTSNEDLSNESARVCLPLLVATIGALLTNNKNDSEHLYEASRRTIHIYLESRKNSVDENQQKLQQSQKPSETTGSNPLGNSNGNTDKGGVSGGGNDVPQSVNPLWLIQSLTLSVIYGLFSDNENNVYIVIRQLNALNSLVKTSIKSNRAVLFSIYGEDHEIFMKCEQQTNNDTGRSSPSKSLFNYDLQDEMRFKNNVNVQSQKRIVFMIYRLTNFLLMMYNVPLTLSINDLGMLDAPNKHEEYLWNFKSFQHFQEHKQETNGMTLGEILKDSENNKIIFREALLLITKSFNSVQQQMSVNQQLNDSLNNLSLFGFISIIHGIFEIKQYQEMKNVDVFSILDNLTRFVGGQANSSTAGQGYQKFESLNIVQKDFEKLDYALLANYTKVSSLVNIKLVKEQSWLRNYDELSKNFNNLLMNMNNISDFDYLKIVDCCIVILKLILFKTEEGNNESNNLNINGNGLQIDGESEHFNFVRTESFHDLVNESLLHMSTSSVGLVNLQNTSSEFEKLMNLKIFEEFDNLKASIHSQMIFHIFAIFSLFSTFMIRKNHFKNSGNHIINEFQNGLINEFDKELNQRFDFVLKILGKIETFLKEKYENLKLENDFANLYLYSNNGFSTTNYSLEKSLYILKIGELILGYMYDTNIKVCIFQKLSGSLSQLRKFMIDNEGRILS